MMELNKIAADLEMIGNIVKKIEVKNTIVTLPDDAKKEFGFDVVNIKIGEEDNELLGQIEIDVVVLAQCPEGSTKIEIISEGCFSAPKSIGTEKFQNMVAFNGAASLYSICRAKIEILSASIYNVGRLTLPYINIYEYYKERNENALNNEKD